jgi:nicotinamide riboside kinase
VDEIGFPSKYLIDGIDRLGKSSLVKRIQDELGYHLVIHYDKPQVLTNYLIAAHGIKESTDPNYDFVKHLSVENIARYLYQEEVNRSMFELMKNDVPIIFDRTHLGEMVYAPLYRGYSGDYVYRFEKEFIDEKMYTQSYNVRLILLISSNTEMLQDDGRSFDPTKKDEEQKMFIEAFNKSQLTNKVIVDVHNGAGGYKSFEDVFTEAIYKPYKK